MKCPKDHKHGGSRNCYSNHGCRCDNCRTGAARLRREYDWHMNRIKGRDVQVPAVGTRRRLEALAFMGWSTTVIAPMIGSNYRPLLKIRSGEVGRVRSSTARRVQRIFRELCSTEAPGSSGVITRGYARKHGYLSHLAWDNIDDPNETPAGLGKSRGVDRELVLRLVGEGMSDPAVAERAGCHPRTVLRVRKEAA